MMAMRRGSAFTLALMLPGLLLLPQVARATEEWPVEVCQPILVGDAIVLSRCTMIESLGGREPAREILFTAKANCTLVAGARGEDRNAAHLDGIEVRVERDTSWDAHWPWTEKDTLASATVTVDVTHAKNAISYGLDVVVRATVEAILVNGAASSPPIRVLRVRVLGGSTLAKYGGVFHLQKLGRLPRTKEFY